MDPGEIFERRMELAEENAPKLLANLAFKYNRKSADIGDVGVQITLSEKEPDGKKYLDLQDTRVVKILIDMLVDKQLFDITTVDQWRANKNKLAIRFEVE